MKVKLYLKKEPNELFYQFPIGDDPPLIGDLVQFGDTSYHVLGRTLNISTKAYLVIIQEHGEWMNEQRKLLKNRVGGEPINENREH